MSDLISRQAAIDAIDAVFPVDPMKSEYAQGIACGAALAKTYVEQLPSAQPERQINLDGTPIEILSELRSQFNCFDEREEKAYHALSEAIHVLSAQERTSPCADCQEFDCYGCDAKENRYE